MQYRSSDDWQVSFHGDDLPAELLLWRAVLLQAIRAAASNRGRNSREDQYWLLRSTRQEVGSCAWICNALDLDLNRLRTGLKAWLPEVGSMLRGRGISRAYQRGSRAVKKSGVQ